MDKFTTEVVILAKEISNVTASITNRIGTRKAHPTYGITKGALHNDAHRLRGLIEAYRILTGDSPPVPDALLDAYALKAFGINLSELTANINAS